jgi:hypothetical protein
MKRAAFLAVLTVTLLPSLAAAGPGCKGEKMEETAASCAPGTTWDSATSACVANPTS